MSEWEPELKRAAQLSMRQYDDKFADMLAEANKRAEAEKAVARRKRIAKEAMWAVLAVLGFVVLLMAAPL